MYNIKASGDWDGNNLFVIAGGAHDIYIHDVDINLPKLNNPKRVAIEINDDDKITYSHNITFKNIKFSVSAIKQFIEVKGTGQQDIDNKITFDNIIFEGRVLNKQANAISITNSPGVTLNKVQVSEGNILLNNAGSAKIDGLNAPQSNIINRNSKGRKPQVLASKFRGMKNTD